MFRGRKRWGRLPEELHSGSISCSLVLLVVVALLSHAESPRKIDACMRSDSGAVVEVRGSAAVLSGHLTVIPCPK